MAGKLDLDERKFERLNSQLAKRWQNSDIHDKTIEDIVRRVVHVNIDGKSLFAMATLFDNQSFVNIVNLLDIENRSCGSYVYFNEYNPALPIRFDKETRKYTVDAPFFDHPVAGVNWMGAKMICSVLGGRLLKEKEWEFLANGGDQERVYPWGAEKPTKEHCNFSEIVGTTTPIFNYAPNDLGFYDMAGNLGEWCDDSRENFPQEKVVKGGGYNKDAHLLEIKSKRYKWERIGTVGIGFRVCWDEIPIIRKLFNG